MATYSQIQAYSPLPPFGRCQCGCGEKTNIQTKTNTARGLVRGVPALFRSGHHQRVWRVPVVCELCGKEFRAEPYWAKRQRFCSKHCSVSAQNHYGRTWSRNLPTGHPTTIDISWAAGIYEGEGSVSVASGGIGASVGQNGTWLPSRLRDLFGGSVAKTRSKGDVKSGFVASDDYYVWRLHGVLARGFLLTIFKFMSPKRQKEIVYAMENH